VDAPAFASRLTQDLQSISHDRHLRVRAGGPPSSSAAGTPGVRTATPFGRTERLEGNVAYIEITTFSPQPGQVREIVRDVMDEAADARALILDVRRNGGGTPGLVALISSYLFGDEPVHLNSLYWRPTDTTQDFFTDPAVPGRRFGPDKPVYVLTSARTFSAAEEFTYNLQTRKRATIVGETTGGGAHPGGVVALPNGLSVFVPSGRAINPITKTNWEGTGITPDVKVPADGALEAALQRIRMKA
jgi:retinol-binding protein 3